LQTLFGRNTGGLQFTAFFVCCFIYLQTISGGYRARFLRNELEVVKVRVFLTLVEVAMPQKRKRNMVLPLNSL